MSRWIVVNPSLEWIQGDFTGEYGPEAAIEKLERYLSVPTENEAWEVFAAPTNFPVGSEYHGGSPELLALLRQNGRARVIANKKVATPSTSYVEAMTI